MWCLLSNQVSERAKTCMLFVLIRVFTSSSLGFGDLMFRWHRIEEPGFRCTVDSWSIGGHCRFRQLFWCLSPSSSGLKLHMLDIFLFKFHKGNFLELAKL